MSRPAPDSNTLSGARNKNASTNVVFSARREYVDYPRVLDCGCTVLHAAAHNESVTRSNVDCPSLARNLEVPVHHIHNLLIRVALHRPPPSFHPFLLPNTQLFPYAT